MYNLEVFTDQFEYVDFDFIDERQPLDMDYLAYNAYTVTTKMMDAKKGYFVRITRDNAHVASGYIADVQPGKTTQEISIKPLQSLFDVEVYYTAVTDCITWLATNIQSALMNNADALQNRPIILTYTPSASALPLTGFNLHETVNILSVMVSALKTYGVVCEMSLDVTNKHIVVNIAQQTATQIIEANLENVIQSSVTLGDSYGSTNKMIIRKTDKDTGESLGDTIFYLHPNGTINTTNNNRIYPVFWVLETLDTEDGQTAAEWNAKALARAKEVLKPATYDNEIVLMYDVDDQIVHPMAAQIGTNTTIYLDGNTYASILTGKKIEGQKITLTYGVVRQDLTKKIAMRQRETLTVENAVKGMARSITESVTESLSETFVTKSSLLNTVYPVGSLYMSVNSVSPATFLGGTWVKIKDTFLLASGDTYSAGNTGGEATHILTPGETALKKHTHTINHGHGFTDPTVDDHPATAATRTTNVAISDHKHTITQPVFKYIKAIADGYKYNGGGAANVRNAEETATATRTTNVAISDHSHTITQPAFKTPVLSHTVSGGAVTNHNGSSGNVTEENGTAHNNMPPYLVVNVWKRTA